MASKALYATFLLGLVSCAVSMVVITADELVTNDCSKGPEYWCRSLESSKECRATKHCIQTVWERQAVPEDDDDICTICKDMVRQARDQLMSNETQEELKEVFEGSCALLPIKMVRMNCDRIVDEFIPELVEMLSSQMNPTVVCTTALLCNNAWVDSLQSEYRASRNMNCETCHAFFDQNLAKLRSSTDLKRVLFSVCSRMNSYSDACSALVEDNMDHIRNYLENAPEFCRPLGFCETTAEIQPLSNDNKYELSSAINDDLECDFCQALVKNLRQILVSNSTETEFLQMATSICKQTGTFSKECLSLVDQYGSEMYSYLMQELDPQQACKLLTLCPTKALAMIKLEPAKRVDEGERLSEMLIGRDEVNSITAVELITEKKPSCIMCEYILHEIVNDLHNATIQEEIETVMKNVCKRLPTTVGDECNKLITTYGDALFFLLSQELDPSVFCVQIQLCPSSNIQLPSNPFKATEGDPNGCALCEFVMNMIDKRLKDNKTEEAIKEALDNICLHLPKSIQQDCKTLVDAYSDEIIEMVIADLTPEEVCSALKLCQPKHLGKNEITLGQFMDKVNLKKSTNTPMCVMCEFAMVTLEKRLLTNATEEEIKRAVQFVCAHLPSTVADMCIDFVEQYGDEIFELLTSQMAPKVVCTELGICIPGFEQAKIESKELTLPSKCEICEIIVEYLDKLLEDDTIEESLDRMIERACTIVPHGARDRCTSMVETYGPYLLSQLGELLEKKKVCQSLHLCKPPAGQIELLGGKQCTWGPAYWCISPEHANACNALEHCQTKVWI